MSIKFLIPLFLLFWSCNSAQKQGDYLSKPIMAEVLADMELAQAAYKFQTNVKKFDIEYTFDEIYKKHQISKEDFNESLKFYASSPKAMDEIYNEAIAVISRKQTNFHVK